jgi:pyruvate/2-oxoglutarate dehydrogenase complex dihydrolipoamide acyltransferase (E2) component
LDDRVDALVEEAAKKAAIAWIAVGGRPAKLVWCAWLGGALLVVSGEGEQAVPGLAEAAATAPRATAAPGATATSAAPGATATSAAPGATATPAAPGPTAAEAAGAAQKAATTGESTVEVSLRGDHGGRIVTFPAEVSRIDPDDEAWAELVPQLASKRLNGAGGAEDLARVWSERVKANTCVVSRLTPLGGTAAMPDDSQAAPPRPTPATRIPRRPFRLHKVRGATRGRKK